MKLDNALLSKVTEASDVAVGNVYPAKGGRKSPGAEFWVVVAMTNTGAVCLGFDKNGEITGAQTYLKSAMRERPLLGRVNVGAITLEAMKEQA